MRAWDRRPHHCRGTKRVMQAVRHVLFGHMLWLQQRAAHTLQHREAFHILRLRYKISFNAR